MNEPIVDSQAFKIKGRLYTFTVLQILTADTLRFGEQLADSIAKAPKLFEQAPVIFDLSLIKDELLDLQALCQIARFHKMMPIALQGGLPSLHVLAQSLGLAVLNTSPAPDKPIIERAVNKQSLPTVKSKMQTTPVRSGQQIVAKGCDLIVTSSVSHGAELLSDGCIHVYGPLRGRALAGISGDRKARIFCQSLEAQLVSIAGFYRLSDAIEAINVPCQIYLVDEHIQIEPL